MQRPAGMTRGTFVKLQAACQEAGLWPRPVLQTIGNAKASAGTHAQDGTLDGEPYCAAFDLRTRDLTTEQVQWLWLKLIQHGIVAYWRHTGSFANNQHIHAIDPALPMKRALRNQVHSFLRRDNGLVGDAPEPFLQSEDHLSDADAQRIRELFLAHNQAVG